MKVGNLLIGLGLFALTATDALASNQVEYIVKLKSGAKSLTFNKSVQSSKPLETTFGQFYVVKSAANADKENFVQDFTNDPNVEYIEPNYEYHLIEDVNESSESELPFLLAGGDPRESEQWALPFLNAQKAWTMTQGSSDIVVAVLDSGIYYDHLDLQKNMWVNEAEKNGKAGVDDDGNAYIDDVYGYNFAYGNSTPKDGDGHGSHCAGVIGATHNNGEGIKGLNANVRLMAVQITYVGGGTTLDKILLGIDYAIKMKADIMTNSWGGMANSQALKEAIAAVGTAGIPFVVASSNEKRNIDSSPSYPASYKLDNMIVVGAHDKNSVMASFSNWGSGTVDIMAPGVDILSTVNYTDWRPYWYRLSSGTSMATPIVAGAVALLFAKEGKLPASVVRERLIRTSRNAAKFSGKSKGGTMDLANFLSNGR